MSLSPPEWAAILDLGCKNVSKVVFYTILEDVKIHAGGKVVSFFTTATALLRVVVVVVVDMHCIMQYYR